MLKDVAVQWAAGVLVLGSGAAAGWIFRSRLLFWRGKRRAESAIRDSERKPVDLWIAATKIRNHGTIAGDGPVTIYSDDIENTGEIRVNRTDPT